MEEERKEVNHTGVDNELIKVGKTLGKIAIGMFSFLGGVAERTSPVVMELAVTVLSRLAENFAMRVLRKNGVDI
jgi:hypothetical protein